jgi:ribosomal protein S7
VGTACMWCTDESRQNTHAHKTMKLVNLNITPKLINKIILMGKKKRDMSTRRQEMSNSTIGLY